MGNLLAAKRVEAFPEPSFWSCGFAPAMLRRLRRDGLLRVPQPAAWLVFLNFWRRATRRCALRRRFSAFRNKRGLPIFVALFSVMNEHSPTSRPTALSFAGSGSGSTMQLKQACGSHV